MLAHLWLSACLLAASRIAALGVDSMAFDEIQSTLSNGDRVRQGLPLKAPVKQGTPRYNAFRPRASDGATTQNTVIQATMGGMGRRAGETYIAFDDSRNAFRLTTNVGEAATFVVPASTVGVTQVRFYTAGGLYYLGASADSSTSSTTSSFSIRGTPTSDLGSPGSSQTQTTIWSFAGIPGALTGTFSALDTTSTLYLSYDSNNYITASSSPADPTRRLSLSLVNIDSLGAAVNTSIPPADSGAPPSDPDVDSGLTTIDTALNAGAGGDEAALQKLMECLSGVESPECDALLATLTQPSP